MKPNTTHLTLVFLSLLATISLFAQAQPLTYIPGPANLDPDSFAHIYFIRDNNDAFPDNWLAVILSTDTGVCVKAKMNHIYYVHTKRTGPTTLHTKIKDVKTELSLNLEAGKDYYIALKPEYLSDGSIRGSLNQLDNHDGLGRLQHFTGKIQQHYCILPLDGNHDYRENTWNDTIHWYASKTHDYHFSPLPSWELLLRDNSNTAFAFRNPLISTTYSEAGGITPLPLKKCTSQEMFDDYCNTSFMKTTLDKQHNALTKVTINPVPLPEGISYARMVSLENTNTNTLLPETPQLFMRSIYIVFFWTDDKGKGNTACLYLSERGLPNELHTTSTLQERLLWVWQSFKLVNTT
ncbi:hypothetical protein [Aestuariibaculum suncheonense]|uniref:Uncharacterized protein n=1 Tax=Aestuariibaculum suncheonense TaxID=1028745 RepID=A0A8J6Q5G3_9FLAO|nr:hypothetical protein [Aestuariibaculum suncheonense]MBD0834416.1 hypothetical protein [Aestuariibaculum suncheonense]